MDTFVCSSWYFLRYPSSHDTHNPFTKEALSYWLPVDTYVGGAEHAVLHLLYARFMTKALRDMGFLALDEPFTRLRNQGLILGEDGEKMSKSRGNVINPDDIVATYGADTMRIYIMFMGPLEDAKPWNTASIMGSRRFLDKTWNLFTKTAGEKEADDAPKSLAHITHKTIKKVTDDIVTFHFNTAISALMILLNAIHDAHASGVSIGKKTKETFLLLLCPFAPHIAEELWESLGYTDTIAYHPWPEYDASLLIEDTIQLIIQINGKTRGSTHVSAGISEEEAKKIALSQDVIQKWISGKEIKKIIFARGKLLNIVCT
jgi:leucyl-tRNA synthetase